MIGVTSLGTCEDQSDEGVRELRLGRRKRLVLQLIDTFSPRKCRETKNILVPVYIEEEFVTKRNELFLLTHHLRFSLLTSLYSFECDWYLWDNKKQINISDNVTSLNGSAGTNRDTDAQEFLTDS